MAEFQCIVEGSPTLSVQWKKDENWILEDPKIERTFENNVAILRIPASEVTHSGKYTCQVVNEAGQDKCFATLTVQGIPVLMAIKSLHGPDLVRNVVNFLLCFAL